MTGNLAGGTVLCHAFFLAGNRTWSASDAVSLTGSCRHCKSFRGTLFEACHAIAKLDRAVTGSWFRSSSNSPTVKLQTQRNARSHDGDHLLHEVTDLSRKNLPTLWLQFVLPALGVLVECYHCCNFYQHLNST